MSRIHPFVRAAHAFALAAAVLSGCSDGDGSGASKPEPSPRGTPTGRSASLVIGASGGEVVSSDGFLTVTVPPGAVAADTDFTIVEITNTAPGGVGAAYRLGPSGLQLAAPVTLLFTVPAAVTAPVNGLAISTQGDGTGSAFWVRTAGSARTESPRTLSTPVAHFSDWALVLTATTSDLNGPLTVTSTLDGVTFAASGWATLSHAGGSGSPSYYVTSGTLTLVQPVTYASGSCTSAQPLWTLLPNVAALFTGPAEFEYAVSGLWDLTCTGGSSAAVTVDLALDTYGVAHYACARGYVGSPILTADQVVATYRVDCGARGTVEASWDLVSCTPGVACTTNPGLCVTGTTSCATGRPVCADTTTPKANGTVCGTNLVCNAGSCVACTAGVACSTNPNACVDGVTSCATGVETCVDSTTAKTNGTSCGTDQVCNGGTCTACIAGGACATNPNACVDGVLSCATGAQTCVDTAVQKLEGTVCGTDQVCHLGVCTGCVAGAACSTNPNGCVAGATSCLTGVQTCLDTTANLAPGLTCGTDQVCDGAGACVACAAGQACQNPGTCVTGAIACGSGTPVCTNTTTPSAPGLTCGTDQVCDGAGLCVACTTGQACQNPGACVTGAIACGSGAPVCTNTTTPSAPGLTCGPGQVCDGAGLCVACAAGQACQNPTSCLTGLTSCASGASVCVDTVAPRAAGEACGTDQVCDGAGVCVSCVAGQACTGNLDPCRQGVTSCATGTQACVDSPTVLTGQSCGTNLVCDPSGACVACTAGLACQNPGVCVTGAIACGSGAPVCTDTVTPSAAGLSCGPNQVCNGAGACVACTAGQACQNPTACVTGLTSCATGASVCVDTAAPRAAGEACGTDQVCDGAGVCVACTAGLACTTNPNVCRLGATSCATGAQTCEDTGTAAPAGTPCPGGTCDGAGICVP